MLDAIAPFSIGLAGSLHCLGMCGPIVLAYSIHDRVEPQAGATVAVRATTAALANHVAFHAGRILTYSILGAIVAALLGGLQMQRFAMQYRAGVAVFCGALLVGFGLVEGRILPLPSILSRLLMAPSGFSPKEPAGLPLRGTPGRE